MTAYQTSFATVSASTPMPGQYVMERALPRLLARLADGRRADLNSFERTFGPVPLPVDDWGGGRKAARRAAGLPVRWIAESTSRLGGFG